MTDRLHSLTVVLDFDIREDDAEPLIAAISQMRRVVSVMPHVANLESHMAEERARARLRDQMIDLLWPKVKP